MGYILKQKGFDNEELKAKSVFRVGMQLYGYCCGVFGRDSYGIKTIVGIEGNCITVNEKGLLRSGEVYSWINLLESSNEALEEEEYEDTNYG